MSCESCIYYLGTVNIFDKVGYLCSLTNKVLEGSGCALYNRDLSDESMCLNCKHFLGNAGDWGLCCSKHYHKLCTALSNSCEDFESKKGEM